MNPPLVWADSNADLEITLHVDSQELWFNGDRLSDVIEALESAMKHAEHLAEARQRRDDARRESDYRNVRGY